MDGLHPHETCNQNELHDPQGMQREAPSRTTRWDDRRWTRVRLDGDDDSHAIRHLLMRHGVGYNREPWWKWSPSIEKGCPAHS